MPWQSKRQMRWGNSSSGVQAMGAAKVHEFNEATKGKKLPEESHLAKRMKGAHCHKNGVCHDHPNDGKDYG